MRRILMALVAMLIPVTALTVGLSGTAGASAGKIECTGVSGTALGDVTISGCTGGNTGGSSEPAPGTDLEFGGTLDWVSGSTTTIDAPTLTTVKNTKCPGYVKPPRGTTPPEPLAEGVAADITGDTGDGVLLPGTATGEVCVGLDGTITILKKFEFEWTPSTLECTAISGTALGDITISGCSGGNTGGSSVATPGTTLETGGTITWVSGGSVTFGTPTLTDKNPGKDCPGYVAPVRGQTPPPEPYEVSFKATVTADTGDGLGLPGKAKGAVCIASDGTITDFAPLVAS